MLPTNRSLLSFVSLVLFLFFVYTTYQRNAVAYTETGPSYGPFNKNATLPSTPNVIATFLSKESDEYLTAARVLGYQLLHAEKTRINKSTISFFVLCTPTVPLAHKERLQKDGIIVVDVKNVPLNWWIYSGVQRWKEQFTKLRLFEMTQYERVLFIDADTMLTSRIDAIFDEPEIKTLTPTLFDRTKEIKRDESDLPQQWLFVAPSDNEYTGERQHPVPHLQTQSFSAGFWVIRPDKEIYKHLLSVMAHFRRFDPFTMEQSLLNYVYRREGPMPWRNLNWKWCATWPNESDEDMGVVSLHEKWWKTGPERLQNRWKGVKEEMEKYHDQHNP